jgi:putative transposase
MSSLFYAMLVVNSKEPELIRKKVVEKYYELHKNASQTARELHMKRQTVSFWVQRYKCEGIEGLKNRSRAPHTIPHKTPASIEDKIIAVAKAKKCHIGQDRIQNILDDLGWHRSTATINRIMHEHDLIKKRIRKYKKKKQIQAYKKTLKALRHWQVDVKDLIDIPNIYALIQAMLFPAISIRLGIRSLAQPILLMVGRMIL